jgi:glycogen synthase
MKKPNVLITTMEYDEIRVGGLSAAVTSMATALKRYVNPIIILPRSGYSPRWKKVAEKKRPEVTVQVYEHKEVSVHVLFNQVLDEREVYPEPADQKGIEKIDEFSKRLVEVVDEIDFDVVHMQDFFAYKAMDKFKEMNKPIVLTIHRLHREYPSWFSGERTALDKADYITVVGKSYYKEDEKQLFQNYENKTTHVFNGVDTKFWNAQACSHPKQTRRQRRKRLLQEHGLTDGVFFTYIGRFDPVQKGVDVLLKASDEFLRTGNVRMIVIGVGDKELEKNAKELEAEQPSKLKVINQLLPRETVRDVYSSADFALIPSVFEPFGLVQLEAMACECVPIGSKTGGIKDTIVSYEDDPDRATGFLVEKGEPVALVNGMSRALRLFEERPETVENMRKNGRNRCEAVFQWDASAKKYFDIYEKLLQHH